MFLKINTNNLNSGVGERFVLIQTLKFYFERRLAEPSTEGVIDAVGNTSEHQLLTLSDCDTYISS